MNRNGTHVIYHLSELPPHWRMSEPDDPRLMDFLRSVQLIDCYEWGDRDWTPQHRIACLAMLEFHVIDDRDDEAAQAKARKRDRENEQWTRGSKRFPAIIECRFDDQLEIFRALGRAKARDVGVEPRPKYGVEK